MEHLFMVGVVLFVTGLVLSHVVLFGTRSAFRAGRPMRRLHRILMWVAVGCVLAGLAVGAVGYRYSS